MKKVIGIIIAAIAVLGLLWLWGNGYFTSKTADEAVEEVTGAAVDIPQALDSASEAVGAAVETAPVPTQENVDTATEAATGVVEAAPEAVDQAIEAAPAAIEGAVDTATEAATGVVEAAPEAVDQAIEAAPAVTEGAVDTATEAATGAANTATQAVGESAAAVTEPVTEPVAETAPDALSVEGFDMGKANEMIDGSDIGPLKKTMLKGALKKAQDNPELLKATLEQIKGALGL